MKTRILNLAARTVARAVLAGSLTLLLVMPASANQWAAEGNIALNGTNLTYYAQPSQGQCHVDCVNNPRCQGATWIQGGTYASSAVGMCYLLSAVTQRVAARGHVSMVKTTSGTGGAPTGPGTNLAGEWSWAAQCPESQQPYTGRVTFSQNGDTVAGGFHNGGGTLSGRVAGNRMEFVRAANQQLWQGVATPSRMDGTIVRPTEGKPNCSFHALRG